MKKAIVMKFACSAALLGTVAVGCKPASHPAALSSVAPRADKQAATLADKAAKALAKQDLAGAVKLAEDAVALAPREASHRVLLGRAYIASGRFVSAEAALSDALRLNPGDGQAELSLALTRIALGKWDQAREMLAAAKGKVGESDRGLALALAGDKPGGVEALEGAARAEGAGAKARQNLALGYALSGRWAEAASIAAQDLPPALVKARMSEWAQMSQPKDAWDQVAALMHVTPVEDAGLPDRVGACRRRSRRRNRSRSRRPLSGACRCRSRSPSQHLPSQRRWLRRSSPRSSRLAQPPIPCRPPSAARDCTGGIAGRRCRRPIWSRPPQLRRRR